MLDTKTMTVLMNEQQWEKLGVRQDGASLFTTISLVEGEVLGFIEGKKEITLTDIVNELGLPEPIVMMGVGGLIIEGLVAAKRHNQFVLLSEKD
jgi:hypothetical protein